MNFKEELLLGIWEKKLIKFGDFKLSSGLSSNYYIDLRPLPSYPRLLKLAVLELKEALKEELSQDVGIATIELSGIPLATALAYATERPLIYVRKKQKDYGTKSLIEGDLSSAREFIVVDDVLTTGSSVLQVVSELRSNGVSVKTAAVVFDRLQGGEENLLKNNVRLRKVFDIGEAAVMLKQRGLISQDELNKILKV
ncbi:orotate phosphoribosyltransferase [archaeon]|nr:orotate phosphoribosyltransferase [archaeon]